MNAALALNVDDLSVEYHHHSFYSSLEHRVKQISSKEISVRSLISDQVRPASLISTMMVLFHGYPLPSSLPPILEAPIKSSYGDAIFWFSESM